MRSSDTSTCATYCLPAAVRIKRRLCRKKQACIEVLFESGNLVAHGRRRDV